MRRTELFEIHDHPCFPAFLRDLVTDALQALWGFSNSYKPILPLLRMHLPGSERERFLIFALAAVVLGSGWYATLKVNSTFQSASA